MMFLKNIICSKCGKKLEEVYIPDYYDESYIREHYICVVCRRKKENE